MSVWYHLFVEAEVTESQVVHDLEMLMDVTFTPGPVLAEYNFFFRNEHVEGYLEAGHTFDNDRELLFENYRFDLIVRTRRYGRHHIEHAYDDREWTSRAFEALRGTGRYALLLVWELQRRVDEYIPAYLGTYFFVYIEADVTLQLLVEQLQPILGVELVSPSVPPHWNFEFTTTTVRGHIRENSSHWRGEQSHLNNFRYEFAARERVWQTSGVRHDGAVAREVFDRLKATGRYTLLLRYGTDHDLEAYTPPGTGVTP